MVETWANKHYKLSKRYLAIILLLLGLQAGACAQETNEIYTIYLVRHSEKDLTIQSDPPLTPCGEQRSESLCSFFSAVDLDAIYSTNYARTQNTALPTATSKGLEIQEYDPQALKDFSKFLLESKQDALVVGHSNTTGVLAGLLVNEEMGAFELDIYNRVYQVVISGTNKRLHLFHTAFDCKN